MAESIYQMTFSKPEYDALLRLNYISTALIFAFMNSPMLPAQQQSIYAEWSQLYNQVQLALKKTVIRDTPSPYCVKPTGSIDT